MGALTGAEGGGAGAGEGEGGEFAGAGAGEGGEFAGAGAGEGGETVDTDLGGREWLKGIDAELAGDPSLKAIQDIPTLVKSYVHAQKMVGRDKVVVPDSNSSDEEWRAFYQRAGMPDTLDNYELTVEGLSDEDLQDIKQMAYENNITPNQMLKVLEHQNERFKLAEQVSSEEDASLVEEGLQQLREEWGEEGFVKNVNAAQTVLAEFGSEELDTYLEETGLADDPMLIKLLAKIGTNLTEDHFEGEAVAHLGVSKEDANMEIERMFGDGNHAYWNQAHANHNAAVKRMAKLQEIIAS